MTRTLHGISSFGEGWAAYSSMFCSDRPAKYLTAENGQGWRPCGRVHGTRLSQGSMAMFTVMVLVSPIRTTGALPLIGLVKMRRPILVTLRGF